MKYNIIARKGLWALCHVFQLKSDTYIHLERHCKGIFARDGFFIKLGIGVPWQVP